MIILTTLRDRLQEIAATASTAAEIPRATQMPEVVARAAVLACLEMEPPA
jgi:hypothetical protein